MSPAGSTEGVVVVVVVVVPAEGEEEGKEEEEEALRLAPEDPSTPPSKPAVLEEAGVG